MWIVLGLACHSLNLFKLLKEKISHWFISSNSINISSCILSKMCLQLSVYIPLDKHHYKTLFWYRIAREQISKNIYQFLSNSFLKFISLGFPTNNIPISIFIIFIYAGLEFTNSPQFFSWNIIFFLHCCHKWTYWSPWWDNNCCNFPMINLNIGFY